MQNNENEPIEIFYSSDFKRNLCYGFKRDWLKLHKLATKKACYRNDSRLFFEFADSIRLLVYQSVNPSISSELARGL